MSKPRVHYKLPSEDGTDIMIQCEVLFWGTKLEWIPVLALNTELPTPVTVCFVKDTKTGEVVSVWPQQLIYEIMD